MALSPEEQQQLDEIKGWWKKNGPSITLGVVLAAVAVGGYKGWGLWQGQVSQEAAVLYRNHSGFLQQEQLPEANDTLRRLQQDYSSSLYAAMASLIAARAQLEAGERDAAMAALSWTREHASDPAFASMAALRLAYLHASAQEWEQGLAVLDDTEIEKSFAATEHEIRGDLYRLAGRFEEARQEYVVALEKGQGNVYLELKLADVGSGDSVLDEDTAPTESAPAE